MIEQIYIQQIMRTIFQLMVKRNVTASTNLPTSKIKYDNKADFLHT
jgi:hypothetical protein